MFQRWRGRYKRRVEDIQHQVIHVVSVRKFTREISDKARFRKVFKEFQSFPLTKPQTEAAVSHYQETLIIASAGSGKTSLLLGRAKYLLASGRVEPNRILALAFNKRAAEELSERAEALDLPIRSMTFHGFGFSVLNRETRSGGVAFAEAGTLDKFLQSSYERISQTEGAPVLADYFAEMLVPFRPFEDFANLNDYAASARSVVPMALSNDYVKSHGEWLIANFLWRNRVNFEYEALFVSKMGKPATHRPDFTVHQNGRPDIYIEYLGIDAAGNTAPWVNKDRYLGIRDWKRELHASCGTQLLELTYQDLKDGVLLTKLKRSLQNYGIRLDPRPDQEILEQANTVGFTSQFIDLTRTFLGHSRARRFTSDNLPKSKDPRSQTFLKYFALVLAAYEDELARINLPDFAALIHEAADQVGSLVAPFPFDHVLVDEYQDISFDRQRLLDSMLIANPKLEMVMVGDDWQAINRFAGSDISIMRDASKPRKNRKLVRLGETHRFPQSLADASSSFIQKNPYQIEKKVTSTNPNNSEATLFLHWDSSAKANSKDRESQRKEREKQANDQLALVIRRIDQGNNPNSTLLVLARYRSNLPSRQQVEALWQGPFEIRTIHTSKGMEADYVIVMDVRQDRRGFPSTIEDDPILRLVLPEQEDFAYAEERRIFYVALTRAQLACHLIAAHDLPSLFALELKEEGVGIHLGSPDGELTFCPVCKTGLLVESATGNGFFCTNDPHCKIPKPKCPKCKDPANLACALPITYQCKKHPDIKFETCSACRWGVLVTRKGRYGEFKSCHTWPTTGCQGKQR